MILWFSVTACMCMFICVLLEYMQKWVNYQHWNSYGTRALVQIFRGGINTWGKAWKYLLYFHITGGLLINLLCLVELLVIISVLLTKNDLMRYTGQLSVCRFLIKAQFAFSVLLCKLVSILSSTLKLYYWQGRALQSHRLLAMSCCPSCFKQNWVPLTSVFWNSCCSQSPKGTRQFLLFGI